MSASASAPTTIKVGVVGVGALGRHHARLYANMPGAQLVGVFDQDAARAQAIAAQYHTVARSSLPDLLADAQALSVAVPTRAHHAVARECLQAGRDVLVEKPITDSVEQAEDLIALAEERQAILQVGHVERFNPAVRVLLGAAARPQFIEVHRLGVFSPRSLDIDAVLDLMIHDLDIVLALDSSPLAQVDAVGVPVLTNKVDIANARLRLESGLIANITASRVSSERKRKFRIFAPQIYISADLDARECSIYRLLLDAQARPSIVEEKQSAPDEEPLRLQLVSFVNAVARRSQPLVSGRDGLRALALAQKVLAAMGHHTQHAPPAAQSPA
jgi:predicted dehydrogenase